MKDDSTNLLEHLGGTENDPDFIEPERVEPESDIGAVDESAMSSKMAAAKRNIRHFRNVAKLLRQWNPAAKLEDLAKYLDRGGAGAAGITDKEADSIIAVGQLLDDAGKVFTQINYAHKLMRP